MAFYLADSTIYNDGRNLDTTAHARNLYNPSDLATSIYGRLNGNISNMSFRSRSFRGEYYWPNLMARCFGTASLQPVEYFSDSKPDGSSPISSSYAPEEYGTIAGTSIKFFLPYQSMCLIDISTYLSIWRHFYVNDSGGYEYDTERKDVYSHQARLRLVVDNLVVQERGLPFSAQASPANRDTNLLREFDTKGESVGDVRMHEVTQGFYYAMHAQLFLRPGWHEAHIDYKLSADGRSMNATIKRGAKTLDTTVMMYDRLFCGIRNARVLSLYSELAPTGSLKPLDDSAVLMDTEIEEDGGTRQLWVESDRLSLRDDFLVLDLYDKYEIELNYLSTGEILKHSVDLVDTTTDDD